MEDIKRMPDYNNINLQISECEKNIGTSGGIDVTDSEEFRLKSVGRVYTKKGINPIANIYGY